MKTDKMTDQDQDQEQHREGIRAPLLVRGIGISSGSTCGRLCFLERRTHTEVKDSIKAQVPGEAWESLQEALHTAALQTEELEHKVRATVGAEEAEIFGIHRMLLEDEDFLDALRMETDKGCSAQEALSHATDRFCQMLLDLEDEYLSARVADLRDVSLRVARILSGEGSADAIDSGEPFILVARDLSPSQTVSLDKSKILGFVTFEGTPNSHTAILARAMGIPALVGTGDFSTEHHGKTAILDAQAGRLLISPTEEEQLAFAEDKRRADHIAKAHEEYLRSLMGRPAVTKSGHRMMIYANIGGDEEVAAVLAAGADGIGLLRSEFLYLRTDDYPTEEALFSSYAEIARRMQGKRTIIRTLDIGADKRIPYFGLPEEENPALGFRAIRICLARKELFKTQLRAILRASAYGRLGVMFPMVVSVEEVKECRRLLCECMQELQMKGQSYDPKIEVGIMIETPAAAVMSRALSNHVDFFSVGTNDLSQYTLAADRQNPALARLLEENTEPILRLIAQAAEAIHQSGGWIGICGEMAADLSLTQAFADLRIDELSVSVPYLLGLRGRVCECK